MRRTSLALALMLAAAGPSPVLAQDWGGWRPCFGPCRPWSEPGWGGEAAPAPWRLGVARGFAPGSWWSPRAVRWRRSVGWPRPAAAAHTAAAASPPSRFDGWIWRHRSAPTFATRPAPPAPQPVPQRDEAAVAALPAGSLPRPRRPRALAPSRVLAAAMLRREAAPQRPPPVIRAVVRAPEPVPRPADEPEAAASPRGSRAAAVPRRPIRPAALRSQPAAPPATEPLQPPAAAPSPAPAAVPPAAADVPVAPLD